MGTVRDAVLIVGLMAGAAILMLVTVPVVIIAVVTWSAVPPAWANVCRAARNSSSLRQGLCVGLVRLRPGHAGGRDSRPGDLRPPQRGQGAFAEMLDRVSDVAGADRRTRPGVPGARRPRAEIPGETRRYGQP